MKSCHPNLESVADSIASKSGMSKDNAKRFISKKSSGGDVKKKRNLSLFGRK